VAAPAPRHPARRRHRLRVHRQRMRLLTSTTVGHSAGAAPR
jgi:hypothetical protein